MATGPDEIPGASANATAEREVQRRLYPINLGLLLFSLVVTVGLGAFLATAGWWIPHDAPSPRDGRWFLPTIWGITTALCAWNLYRFVRAHRESPR
jgi:hypothetical protein